MRPPIGISPPAACEPRGQARGVSMDRPNRIPWPPILFGSAALAAWLAGAALPLPWPGATSPGATWLGIAGWGLIAAGLGLDLWAMAVMRRRRANILPHRAATTLVTTGPFAWSRNPIYLGNTLLLAGCGLAIGNPWFLAAALAAALAVTGLAIRREEAHLAALFGEDWQRYAARTGRWLGRR